MTSFFNVTWMSALKLSMESSLSPFEQQSHSLKAFISINDLKKTLQLSNKGDKLNLAEIGKFSSTFRLLCPTRGHPLFIL